MTTNTKQFPNDQLFDLEVLQQTEKGAGEEQFAPQFTQNGGVQFHPNFRHLCPLGFYMISIVRASYRLSEGRGFDPCLGLRIRFPEEMNFTNLRISSAISLSPTCTMHDIDFDAKS